MRLASIFGQMIRAVPLIWLPPVQPVVNRNSEDDESFGLALYSYDVWWGNWFPGFSKTQSITGGHSRYLAPYL